MKAISIRLITLIGLWLSAISSITLFAIALFIKLETGNNPSPTAMTASASMPKTTNIMQVEDNSTEDIESSKTQAPVVTEAKSVDIDTAQSQSADIKSTEENDQQLLSTITTSPEIAIIIDDLGYQWRNGLRTINLKGDFTLSILPFGPYSTQLANEAHLKGKEVMLHAPMEPIAQHNWENQKGLSNDTDQLSMKTTLALMLKNVPNVKGINNHMGSSLTQNAEVMNWFMGEISTLDLFFIDSVTTAKSQAFLTAKQHHIPSKKRDVFLDNVRTPKAIDAQLNKLINIALKQGSAIGICHPYPETIAFLESAEAKIIKSNIRLVSITTLLSNTLDESVEQKVTGGPSQLLIKQTNSATSSAL